MAAVTIVVAGTGFAALRQFMNEEMAQARVEMIDPPALRAGGFAAEVLIPAMARIDGALMDRIAGLRLIQQWGAGLEGVDIDAASARRIAVANVPTPGTGNAESVAEWCVMAAIAVSRRLPVAIRTLQAAKTWGYPMGRALLGRAAGIVGLGGIGQALAARLRPFGMRLIGVKRSADPELARRLGMEWIGGRERLAELLRQSDYLFLCLPLREDTRAILDESALAMLPAHACVVNAARGGLIDQSALLRALEQGRLCGAGLDVFEHEPLAPGSPLAAREDVLATPHIAGVTDVSYRGIAQRVAANVRRLLTNQPLQNCVNQDALAKQ